jgi:hypothetical protein
MDLKNVVGLIYFGMPARNENDISWNNQKMIKFGKIPVTTLFLLFFLLPITKKHFHLFFHKQTKHSLIIFQGTWQNT